MVIIEYIIIFPNIAEIMCNNTFKICHILSALLR